MDSPCFSDEFQVLSGSWVDLTHYFEYTYEHVEDSFDPLINPEYFDCDSPLTNSTSSIEVLKYKTPSCSSRNTPTGLETTPRELKSQVQVLSDTFNEQEMTYIIGWSNSPLKPRKKDGVSSLYTRNHKCYSLSFRKNKIIKDGFTVTQILYIIVPTLIISNFFAFGIGFYLGKSYNMKPVALFDST